MPLQVASPSEGGVVDTVSPMTGGRLAWTAAICMSGGKLGDS